MDEVSNLRVTTTDGKIEFTFSEDGVGVSRVGATKPVIIPWSEWEHIARVYGKRRTK